MIYRRKKIKGQAAVEYVTLFILILFTFIYFQKYIVRGFSGRWKGVGESLGQGRIYDPNKTTECRFFSFFEGQDGRWFDQKLFEQDATCEDDCLKRNKSIGKCNGCLGRVSGGCN